MKAGDSSSQARRIARSIPDFGILTFAFWILTFFTLRVAILVTASDKVGLLQADESTANPEVGAEQKNRCDTGLQDVSED